MGKAFLFIFSVIVLSACTSVQIRPVEINLTSQEVITEVCIVKNPAVTIDDFVSVLESRLKYHHFKTQVITSAKEAQCQYYLEYSAKRSWDIVTYLSWAELKVYSGGELVGSAEYRLRNKGGLSLTKWKSVESKMNPVIDGLFIEGKVK